MEEGGVQVHALNDTHTPSFAHPAHYYPVLATHSVTGTLA